jgi:hypothetical protein
MSMKMTSSTIIDLRPFDRRRDLPLGVNGGVGRLNSFRYGPSYLTSLNWFWIFSLGRRKENYPRSICPGGYILDNGDSYSRLPSGGDQVVQLFCPDILVLVLLPIWIDYFNGYARARSLGIATRIKIKGEPSLIFTGLWFSIYLGLPSENYKIVSWRKKEFEDLEDLQVSFRLYCVIVKGGSCVSTMYYLLL